MQQPARCSPDREELGAGACRTGDRPQRVSRRCWIVPDAARAAIGLCAVAVLLLSDRPTALRPIACAHAEDGTMLHIRARTRLDLRELEHRVHRGHFTLTVLAKLGEGASAGGLAAAAAGGDSDATHTFAGQRIELRLLDGALDDHSEVARASVSADHEGEVRHTFAGLAAGAYRVQARYAGDDLRDGGDALLDVNLDRHPAELSFTLPKTVEYGQPLWIRDLRLRSRDEDRVGPVEMTVRAGDDGAVSGPVLHRETLHVSPIATGGDGQAHNLYLDRREKPGRVLMVTARFAGDQDTAPAVAGRETLIVTQARVTLEAAHPPAGTTVGWARGVAAVSVGTAVPDTLEIAQGGGLLLTGTLYDSIGPLAGELVDIEASQSVDSGDAAPSPSPSPSADDVPSARMAPAAPPLRRLLGTAVTDDAGRFRLHIARLPLRVAPAHLVAKAVPARRYIRPAISDEVRILVGPPEPVSLWPFVIPLLLTALLAALVWAARFLAPRIAAWRAARQARKRAQAVLDAPANSAVGSVSASQPALVGPAGVSLGSARSALSLRRTLDSGVDGTVVDSAFGHIVVEATVVATPLLPDQAAEQRATSCDGDGRFALPQLRAGRWVLRVTAPGYQPQEFAATVPHRGELRAVTVRLLPLRAQVVAAWQRVAAAYYGDAGAVQTRTPQDFLRDAVAPVPSASDGKPSVQSASRPLRTPLPAHALGPLRRLTALVEAGYYSRRVCSEEMLQESLRLATELMPEGAPRPAADAAPRAESAPRPIV